MADKGDELEVKLEIQSIRGCLTDCIDEVWLSPTILPLRLSSRSIGVNATGVE